MKVIFLDIDGVLNSRAYDRERGDNDGNIDLSRLPLVKEIVDKSGAFIVLSSNWRDYWEKDPALCSDIGCELNKIFASAGLCLYDKTGYHRLGRAYEIKEWLGEHPDVESFVILDDIGGGWGDYFDNLVRTNYRIKRGLEKEHVERAIAILGEV